MSQKNEIYVKATELFFQYGVRSVTMDDLSRELGISKKTLYQYVDNKSDLVLKSLRLHLNCQKKEINSIRAEANNAIDEVVSIARFTLSGLRRIHPSTMFDIQKYYPEALNEINVYKSEYTYSMLLKNIENGVKEGLYRDNLESDLIVKFYMYIIEQLVLPSNFPSVNYNFSDLYSHFIDYHLHGIVSQKGLTYLKTIDL